jgi:hypothetical protein
MRALTEGRDGLLWPGFHTVVGCSLPARDSLRRGTSSGSSGLTDSFSGAEIDMMLGDGSTQNCWMDVCYIIAAAADGPFGEVAMCVEL